MSIFTEWNGYKREDFLFEGRNAILVYPNKPDKDGRWLFKTEYFGAFPELEIMMLERGFHIAYLKNKSRWVKEDDIEVKDRFIEYLSRERGLNPRCATVGMSCGGMHAVYLASKYPGRVAVCYIDAPVLNLLSCPMALGEATDDSMIAEFEGATGFTLSTLISYRHHPIDEAPKMLAAGVPLFISGGDSDSVVPYSENGALLSEMYRESDVPFREVIVEGRGHHPHTIQDMNSIVEFIERYYN